MSKTHAFQLATEDDAAERLLTAAERAIVGRFDGSAPRYTSYPTAPHFSAAVDSATYRSWLERLPEGSDVSLYVHVPYCSTLCWFCACRTQGVRSYQPLKRYLRALEREIETVSRLAGGCRVRHIHWGGGSPTILAPDDIRGLAETIRRRFTIRDDAEFAVEIDPRDMTEDRLDALADAGVTRASLGVQDFDEDVQAAINRRQSFEATRDVLAGLRARGVRSVNIDALYGLPRQTIGRCRKTLEQVVSLDPDRVALFGYAHVPWMSRRQQLIDQSELPGPNMRYAEAKTAAETLSAAGYQRIGLDHFAKPGDTMARAAAEGRLRRNFQGYTTDGSDALIGLGASAIGRTPAGYVQNVASTAAYLDAIAAGDGLATARGLALSLDDRIRGHAIERLMCDLAFDGPRLAAEFGDLAAPVAAIAARLPKTLPQGLVEAVEGGFRVTELGRPFVRSIAAEFDAYRDASPARYSRAV